MTRVAICAKYFGYSVGGAENSTLQMLTALEAKGHSIVVFRNTSPKHFGAMNRTQNLPAHWEVRDFKLPYDFKRFRYLEYLLNRSALRRLGAELTGVDVLYSYGFEAPGLLGKFSGQRVYVVRDEYGLGWMHNYAGGRMARVVYGLYIALEALPRAVWRRDLAQVLRASHSRALANSRFMADALKGDFGSHKISVLLPQIDQTTLSQDFAACRKRVSHRGVVFVGDGRLKGLDITLKIALAMPETKFHIFARKPLKSLPTNVTQHSWVTPGEVYAHADVVILPSRWYEAYGRVAAEAAWLGVPVVISDRGGLPEAAGERGVRISDPEDISAWVSALRRILAEK